jgi:hypothetical protein
MNEILDHNPNENTPKSNLFSKLAFGCSMLIISCFVIAFKMTPTVIKTASDLDSPSNFKYIGGGLLIFTTLGVVFSIISIIRKEKLKYFKLIAAIFNILCVLLIFGNLFIVAIMQK